MSKPFHNTSNTRLEVALATPALGNFLDNPSGAFGGYGWITPVADTRIFQQLGLGASTLRFENMLTSKPAYWTTDYLPITAGKYVAARFDTVASGGLASHNVKVRFEWYDASKILLSSSVQSTGFVANVAATNYVAGIVAPASTAFVKVRWDFYNGVGNPSIAATYTVRNVMVTWNNTNSFIGVRTNLIPNPSMETNLTKWSVHNGTLARTNAQAAVGSWSMSATAGGDTSEIGTFSDRIPVVGGGDYTFSVRVRAATTGRNVRLRMIFWAMGKGDVGRVDKVLSADTSGGWTTYSISGTAPYDAYEVNCFATVDGRGVPIPAAEVHYFDAFMLERAAVLDTYFDGSTVLAGHTFAWTGTAHGSTSTDTLTAGYPYVDGPTWQNIFGPTHRINIKRAALNVGTLSAEIISGDLDPAAASTILIPGAKVRMMTSVSAGVWDQLFIGAIKDATAVYDKPKDGKPLTTRISLLVTDANDPMASQQEPRTPFGADKVPLIMEGKGVPWKCIGSSAQVPSAALCANIPGASLLDQIALIRDSWGYWSWVDRFGVMVLANSINMPSATEAVFSDAPGAAISYTDISVDYSLDTCINYVTVRWLRYNQSTGETTEIQYGPYLDQASINKWGVRAAEFTLSAGNWDETTLAAFGASVLAANGTPTKRCNGLRMPVRDAVEMGYATTLDLYSKVTTTFDTKITAQEQRIVEIEHNIDQDRWQVDYTFEKPASFAAPTVSPGVGSSGSSPSEGLWITPIKGNGWVDSGGADRIIQYMKRDGIVYIVGIGKTGTLNTTAFTLPAGYRPSGNLAIATIANGAFARLLVSAAGVVNPVAGSNVWFSFQCSFPAEQ